MVCLSCDLPERGAELGSRLVVRILSERPVETRCFLTHRPVTYVRELGGGWAQRDTVILGPEAPGDYTLAVAWRGENGDEGRAKLDFRVREPRSSWAGLRQWLGKALSRFRRSPLPVHRLRVAGVEGSLVGPSLFEVGHLADGEPGMEVLAELIRPGDVVYDIGANIGLYTLVMARLAGRRGKVYGFEANPVCVSYLRSNVALNRLDNVEILPIALLDRDGETAFTVNYGNASLGAAAESIFFHEKIGQEIRVGCAALDTLQERIGLPPPDFVKIDVEGTESRVVAGMSRLLREHRPRLHLELHGQESVRDVLEALDSQGYEYRIASSAGGTPSLGELRHGQASTRVVQILASPRAEGTERGEVARRGASTGAVK